MKFLDEHNILTDLQHGFRAKRSTETQLLLTINDMMISLNKLIKTVTSLWLFLTSQKPLIKSYTSAYYPNFPPTALMEIPWPGLHHFSTTASSVLSVMAKSLILNMFYLVYHKVTVLGPLLFRFICK